MAGTAAIASAVVGGVSTLSQISSSKKAASARRKSERIRERQAQLQAQRERVQGIREARIRRAEVESASVATGTEETSGFQGATGSISSQLGSNLAFSRQQQQTASQLSGINEKIAGFQEDAALAQSIGGVASSIFQDAGGFKTIFKKFG